MNKIRKKNRNITFMLITFIWLSTSFDLRSFSEEKVFVEKRKTFFLESFRLFPYIFFNEFICSLKSDMKC